MTTENLSIQAQIVEEIESCLPDMAGLLQKLDPVASGATEEAERELLRMAHTIRSLADIAFMPEIGKSAAAMEELMEHFLAEPHPRDKVLLKKLDLALESLISCCDSRRNQAASTGVANGADEDEEQLRQLLGPEADGPKEPSGRDWDGDGVEEGDKPSETPFASGDDDLVNVGSGGMSDVDEESSFSLEIDAELLECFNEEAGEHLENIATILNNLSLSVDGPCEISGEYRERLHALRRSVHTLKGAAAVIGIRSVADWGHDFEDFLDWLHDESAELSPEIIGVMQDSGDLLEKLVQQTDLPVSGEIADLNERFAKIMAPLPAETVPSVPAPGIEPEILECYVNEVSDHLDSIARELDELSLVVEEYCPLDDERIEKLNSVFRSVHSLKGAAAAVGINSVADWGHEFETFLVVVMKEIAALSSEIVQALQDGAEMLKRLALNPELEVGDEISVLRKLFSQIVAETVVAETTRTSTSLSEKGDKNREKWLEDLDWERKQVFFTPVSDSNISRRPDVVQISTSEKKTAQFRQETILRIGSRKIAELMGLSGDMAVNLSSFENLANSVDSSLLEFEMIMQRLKTIVTAFGDDYGMMLATRSGEKRDNSAIAAGVDTEFDSLEMDRYSEFHIQLNSLREALVDLDSIRQHIGEKQSAWSLAVDLQRKAVSDLQNLVQSLQMTPFSTISNRLHRTVREAAKSTGKRVQLLIENASIEMYTHIWDVLVDALMHMLRNCVDHGIEDSDTRRRLGKPEQAIVRIRCARYGNRFVLRLSDDGAGLDFEAVRRKALQLYPDAGVGDMTDSELAQLIFKPGFSVRETATPLSGRGVGMDVVRNVLEQLNGRIEVQTVAGQGTTFILSVPVVVALLPALMVKFGRQPFAVPMHDISRVFRITAEEREKEALELNGEPFPLLKPAELLHLDNPQVRGRGPAAPAGSTLALAVDINGRRGVVVIDEVIAQQNVILRSLGPHLQNIALVAGAAVMADGSLVPILKTEDLFDLLENRVTGETRPPAELIPEEKTPEILVVDDSISVRKVLNSLLSSQGWQVTAAKDGVEAMEKLLNLKPDLVFLDIEMPRMNGFEVLQALQSQSRYREVPIYMLTSRSARKYRDKAMSLGARGFITKPFEGDELISLIRQEIYSQ